ncbi:5-formyltetrahydrofolate cyclo-ligase [Cohnella thailandensis]|uniref:5-formyltetrahydrofolate cyclo-ligase n=1 Tax=Cohnella thailandensis TaxID=557557 RepID=A0A841SQI0_9BACL|nr:5-formyltetrahydrofolate cyclo-ligase [Cohnella thailandensis]MBB6633452.1 5-formyltetrahydrofolate cyclo-ligase [Cohnella thailandensis]MBP1974467.1 5-formyltetrahydrofolate cyclo-ligase [Cohnella thailandensis]
MDLARAEALKKALRQSAAAARDSVPSELRSSLSEAVCDSVLRDVLEPLRAERGSKLTVCLYGAFRSEANPSRLADRCREDGHLVLATRVTGDGQGMELRRLDGPGSWGTGRWGVPEPDPARTELYPIEEAVDLILVPGLAFDEFGGRLGYGGGFYDRLYDVRRKNARSAESTIWIGFAFGAQLSKERLPKEDHDLPLDGLATENGIRWYDRRRRNG